MILNSIQQGETRMPAEGQPTQALGIYFTQNQLLEKLTELSISTRAFSLLGLLLYSPIIPNPLFGG